MKRISILVLLLLLSVFVLSAEEHIPLISIGGTAGIYYIDEFPGTNLYNFRGGASIDTNVTLFNKIGAGLEAGFQTSIQNFVTGASLVTMPVRASLSYYTNDIVITPFAGMFFSTTVDTDAEADNLIIDDVLTAGIRLGLGSSNNIFAEYAYIDSPQPMHMFGVGARLGLLNLF